MNNENGKRQGWFVNGAGLNVPNFRGLGSVPDTTECMGCDACGHISEPTEDRPKIEGRIVTRVIGKRNKNNVESLDKELKAMGTVLAHIQGLTKDLMEGKLSLSDAIKAIEDLSRANVASAGDLTKMVEMLGLEAKVSPHAPEPKKTKTEEEVQEEEVLEIIKNCGLNPMIDTLVPTDGNLKVRGDLDTKELNKDFEGEVRPETPDFAEAKREIRDNVIPGVMGALIRKATMSNPVRIARVGHSDKARSRNNQDFAENIVHIAANLVKPEEYAPLVNSFARMLNDMVGASEDAEFTISKGGLIHAMMSLRLSSVLPEDYLMYGRAREIFLKQLAPRLPKSLNKYQAADKHKVHYEVLRCIEEIVLVAAYETANAIWVAHNKLPHEVLEDNHPKFHTVKVRSGKSPRRLGDIPDIIKDTLSSFAKAIRDQGKNSGLN